MKQIVVSGDPIVYSLTPTIYNAAFQDADLNQQYESKKLRIKTNDAGGILGGLSNGMPIVFRVAIKPTSSISKERNTANLETMDECNLKIKGRYDPCIAVRVVPVIESMAAITLVDLLLRSD